MVARTHTHRNRGSALRSTYNSNALGTSPWFQRVSPRLCYWTRERLRRASVSKETLNRELFKGRRSREPVGSRTDTVERGKIWLDGTVLKTGKNLYQEVPRTSSASLRVYVESCISLLWRNTPLHVESCISLLWRNTPFRSFIISRLFLCFYHRHRVSLADLLSFGFIKYLPLFDLASPLSVRSRTVTPCPAPQVIASLIFDESDSTCSQEPLTPSCSC